MQMYYEITNPESVSKIDEALASIHAFDEKLHSLQKRYKADNPYVFNSLDRGLQFSNLWYEAYPLHLDTEKEFKVSSEKYKTGYEVRPRKSNKKFYSEFMSGLRDVNYNNLLDTLFGDSAKFGISISYTKKNDAYYIDSNKEIILQNRELIASEYKKITEMKEKNS